MQPQILLAVADEARRSLYEAFLKKERVICQAVSSLREVATQTAKQPYNAIFLDMPLIVRASRYDKSLVEDALRALPHARLNITDSSGEISMLVSGDNHESSETPEEYLRYCCEQPVKTVLPRNRIPLNLNAELSHHSKNTSKERTVCIDISPGGCFLFSVNDEIALQSTVWINLIILNDPTPILSTVCWKREWGMTNDIPGVGIRFDEMSKHQQEQILTLCREKQTEQP
jgi:CheY-like chemotaxis protein/Tfp pilus assembly protein PilZ